MSIAIATPNIAIVKYWGKRDEELKLPCNDSIAVTLDETFSTRTEVEFRTEIPNDTLEINCRVVSESEISNAKKVLDFLRQKAGIKTKAKVSSRNNFPEAVGIASSASGYAALTIAAANALSLKLSKEELSVAARLGSGSASRSIHGGFTWWKMGRQADGNDSFATQLADHNHWPSFRVITAIVSEEKKQVNSSEGMRRSVESSQKFEDRIDSLPEFVEEVKKAIMEKNPELLFKLAMEDSDNLHEVIKDSKPAFGYLTEASLKARQAIIDLNKKEGKTIAAYSFDAGPNCHIFTEEKHARKILSSLISIGGVQKATVTSLGKGPRVIG